MRHRIRSDGSDRVRDQAAVHPHQQHHPQLICIIVEYLLASRVRYYNSQLQMRLFTLRCCQTNYNMSLRQFQIESKLGQGSFSSVYRVKRIADGQEYAMKKVRMQNLNDKERQNALNQVRILASIKHPNIIGYKETFIDDASDSLIIIMQYASEGDLHRKVNQLTKSKAQFQESEVWRIFVQIVKGLRVLHGLNIQHRDLKSANIFLGKDGIVKIGDLNVSKISTELCRTQTGTPYYASPQVWKDQPYDAKSDIWALGCILYEMITLKPPFRAQDMQGLYKKVVRGFYEKIPSNYSQDLSNVIRMMLQIIPQLRPDCDKLLHQIYLSQHQVLNKMQQPTTKETENTLLDTIKISKNMKLLSDKLPKPDYTYLAPVEKIKKSQSRNSCPKNALLPVINKPQESRKKRYISQKKREKPTSITSCGSEQQIPLTKHVQSKLTKESLKKKLPPSVSRPLLELPFITENDGSPKPKKHKKSSIISTKG